MTCSYPRRDQTRQRFRRLDLVHGHLLRGVHRDLGGRLALHLVRWFRVQNLFLRGGRGHPSAPGMVDVFPLRDRGDVEARLPRLDDLARGDPCPVRTQKGCFPGGESRDETYLARRRKGCCRGVGFPVRTTSLQEAQWALLG